MITKLEFGLALPAPKYIAWGARAIYQNLQIDFLWDRQDMQGGTKEECKQFSDFINQVAIPELRRLVVKEYLCTNESRLVSTQIGEWSMLADPRRSYGYLYILVCPVDGVEGMPDVSPAMHKQ